MSVLPLTDPNSGDADIAMRSPTAHPTPPPCSTHLTTTTTATATPAVLSSHLASLFSEAHTDTEALHCDLVHAQKRADWADCVAASRLYKLSTICLAPQLPKDNNRISQYLCCKKYLLSLPPSHRQQSTLRYQLRVTLTIAITMLWATRVPLRSLCPIRCPLHLMCTIISLSPHIPPHLCCCQGMGPAQCLPQPQSQQYGNCIICTRNLPTMSQDNPCTSFNLIVSQH